MRSASLSTAPAFDSVLAAPEPHLDSQAAQAPGDNGNHSMAVHDRRLALIGSISGSRLLRLRQMIRHEFRSSNGDRGCAQLRSGSVDCSCDYCTFFWSRLEEKLR
jgi:hypothetical protein